MSEYLANELHSNAATPFAGYTTYQNKTITWHIAAYGEFAEEILEAVKSTTFTLKKFGVTLTPEFSAFLFVSEKDYCKKYFIDSTPRRLITLKFITPTAFKSNGKYVIFPSETLLIKSIAGKWDSCAEQFFLSDGETLSQIAEYIQINKYRLKSDVYHIKGIAIPAFSGEVTLKINGPEPLQKVANLMFNFATYSGIGIKTALGMGGVALL
jgi:CRISPR-associated endoribonuclease Cas6